MCLPAAALSSRGSGRLNAPRAFGNCDGANRPNTRRRTSRRWEAVLLASGAVMRGWRAWTLTAAVVAAGVVLLAAALQFLAADLSYQIRDRASEWLSGRGDRPFRIALGARTGSSFELGVALNRYLKAQFGYELELVSTSSPGNV